MKKQDRSSNTPILFFAGAALLAAGVFLSFAGGLRTLLGALAAAVGGFLVSTSLKKEPPPRITLPARRPITASPAPKAETAATPVPAPPAGLDKTDRDRLVEWLAEPIEILEAARKSGELGGFNRARSCRGMAQLAAWRRSKGPHHPDADALAEAAEDAVLESILGAAEYFSPIVESLSRRGELPSDIDRSRAKVEQVRKQTIAILAELRARLSNLPISAQESFGFVAGEAATAPSN